MKRLFKRWGRLKVFSFLLSMPVIILMLELVMYGQRLWAFPWRWLAVSALIFFMGIISMELHVRYDRWVESRYPDLTQTKTRLLIKSLLVLFIMTPSIYIIFIIFHFAGLYGYSLQPDHLWQGALIGLSVNLIFETLYEGDYIFQKKLESAAGNQDLQQRSLGEELSSLKAQINPHFLFNCFNTLSSLIGTDKKRAVLFLDELSKVYRILLRSNQESFSTLAQELSFLHSYFSLLQTRHGAAVRLNLTIDPQFMPYSLPSLSLQLLVENAVKHNMATNKKPLTIDVFTSGENKLVVSNNLQRRLHGTHSNQVGLNNIRGKYQLLKAKGFQVMEGTQNFTVVLPLLPKTFRPADAP